MLWDASWPIQADIQRPIVVFCHGFKGFKDWGHFPLWVKKWIAANLSVFRFNFSHNGTTPEAPTEFRNLDAFSRNTIRFELEDLHKVLAFLRGGSSPFPQTHASSHRIVLVGHSRGGGITLLAAAEDSTIAAVAALASVSTFERWEEPELLSWQSVGQILIPNARTGQQMPLKWETMLDYKIHLNRLNLLQRITSISQPVFLGYGALDTTISLLELDRLKRAIPHAYSTIIPDSNHTFGGCHPWPHKNLPIASELLLTELITWLQINLQLT
jgi:pimeloyl-ACP methyl ester carboxylesterase